MKVVSIAVSFLTVTSLSATFLLSIESLVLVSFLSLFIDAEPIDGLELRASSFVTLPSLPDPIMLDISKLFSAIIFLAEGLGIFDLLFDSGLDISVEDSCDSFFTFV